MEFKTGEKVKTSNMLFCSIFENKQLSGIAFRAKFDSLKKSRHLNPIERIIL